MILIIGITVAFFLEFLLLTKKSKNSADKILATWMFFIGVHLFFRYLIESELIFKNPFLFGISLPFPLIHGPLLLFYIQELSNQKPHKGIYNYIHFLFPSLLYLYLIKYFVLSKQLQIEAIRNNGISYPEFNIILFLGTIISGLVYIIWSGYLLKKHIKKIGEEFSYTENINLNWLRYLTYGLGGIWLAVITSNFIVKDWLDQNLQNRDSIIYYTLVVFVIIIGLYGVKQVGIFSGIQQNLSNGQLDIQ